MTDTTNLSPRFFLNRWNRVISGSIAAFVGIVITLVGANSVSAVVTTPVAASGTGTVTITWGGTATAFSGGSGSSLFICNQFSTSCAFAGRMSYINLTGGTTSISLSEGTSITLSTGASSTLAAGTYKVQLYEWANSTETAVGSLLTVVIGGSGGGGTTPSGTTTSAPVEASLSLDLAASGATCKSGSSATGTVGTWLTLPSADDCTSATRSDAKLLGWSTSKDFPMEIAQRQVSNGWGAYEMTNESGRVTAVFIPAGKATFVSGSNSLYPIWAN